PTLSFQPLTLHAALPICQGRGGARMILVAFQGSSIDGEAYTDVVDSAQHAPGWLDGAVSAWSAYGLVVFAVLMVVGWWRARRAGDRKSTRLNSSHRTMSY